MCLFMMGYSLTTVELRERERKREADIQTEYIYEKLILHSVLPR